MATSISPFRHPLNTARANHSRGVCLGAAKKKKRVRRTEGRTGLHAAARTIANGDGALRNRDVHAVRHKTCRRSAAEISVSAPVTDGLSKGKTTVFSHLGRGFTPNLHSRAMAKRAREQGFPAGNKYMITVFI